MSRRVEVCPLSELVPGRRRLVQAGAQEVLVLNVAGRCHAVLNRCPHAGASLETSGSLRDGLIVCDWHDIGFDLCSGESDSGFELQVFPVVVDSGGIVALELPA